ncbi:MAG: hypothetical protein Q4C95_11880 [Planctomycetia bacterium]|nr:hypothetical protein [Planctomycetia bacterium]
MAAETTYKTLFTSPRYLFFNRFREFVHDCYVGSEAIKESPNSFLYLPMQRREEDEIRKTGNMSHSHYHFRKQHACYENFFKPTIDDIVGIMQKNRPAVKFGVKEASESSREVRDIEYYGNQYGDGLTGLKWRLNFNQALYGRYGLLLDVIADADGLNPRFCISEYTADKILDGESVKRNSDLQDTLQWALLDETTLKFNPQNKIWEGWPKIRVLGIDAAGQYYQAVLEGSGCYQDWLSFDLKNPPADKTIYPTFKQKTLGFIPFTVCNVNRLGINEWQEPPYMDVANIAVANYQIDSYYKRAIQNHATPTLVVCNAAKPTEGVYLGGVIWTQSSGNNQVSASILETSGAGLAEMRNAKESLKNSLKYSSIRDLLDGAGANSSGEAIQLRTASGTAAIAAIDRTGAKALEEQLVFASVWSGATFAEAGDRISFEADVSYLGTDFSLQTVVSLLQANQQTQTLSRQNLYSILEKSVPGTLSSFDDNEIQLVAETDAIL